MAKDNAVKPGWFRVGSLALDSHRYFDSDDARFDHRASVLKAGWINGQVPRANGGMI